MDTWRLLSLQTNNAYMNMAIDEAILNELIIGKVTNTLRFYRWNPSAVSIGRNQNPDTQVHIDSCKRQGVDIVRRISGGGTVYHDFKAEVTYSVTAKTSDFGTGDIVSVYFKIYTAIADALKLLGVPADFSGGDAKNCPNLTVNGKKNLRQQPNHNSRRGSATWNFTSKCGLAKNVHSAKTKRRQLHTSRRNRQTKNHKHSVRTRPQCSARNNSRRFSSGV